MGLCSAKAASTSGVQWNRVTSGMVEKSYHDLYAKPSDSRCVKGQLFNEATGHSQHPAPARSWQKALHPGTSAQPGGDNKGEIQTE